MVLGRVFVLFSSLALSACAQQKQWIKAGSGLNEFNQDRYGCMQQSQQPTSSAYIGRYGGAASSQIITNNNLFSACMNSQGWVLSDVGASGAYKDAMTALAAQGKELCTRLEFQAHFAKSPCEPNNATPAQLADGSKISPQEKIALVKLRAEGVDLGKKYAAAHRQYNEKTGDALGTHIERQLALSNNIYLDFAEGRITRGQYNTRRRDQAAQSNVETQRILSTN